TDADASVGMTPWDVKRLLKTMVMSATYRQSSVIRKPVISNQQGAASDSLITDYSSSMRDPDNRLLARGPRVRLPAEMIRDQALAASGLLAERLGGPPARPYHPSGLYEQIVYQGGKAYELSKGADLYRRSVYTFWKRSLPH